MKNKTYLILLGVMLLLAGYFYFFSSDSTLHREYSDFAVEDTASVSKIFIADPNGQNALLERMDRQWLINGKYKARQDAIDVILKTIHSIRVKAPIPQKSMKTMIKLLAVNSTKVEIYTGGDKPEKIYYVGHATKSHEGTNMLLEINGEKSDVPYVTHIPGFFGYLSTRFFTDEDDWKDRAIFEYLPEEIASISLEYREKPTQSFQLFKEGEDIKVVDFSKQNELEDLDEQMAMNYLDKFKSVHYEMIEKIKPQEFIDSVIASDPIHIFNIKDINGNTKKVKTFYKPVKEGAKNVITGKEYTYNVDQLYALIDGKDFVIMQWPILDVLLFRINDFRMTESVDNLSAALP